jgi:hypothetical protein
VETTGTASVSVEIDEDVMSGKKESSARRTLSENEFFSEIADEKAKFVFRNLLIFAREIDAQLSWGASSVSIRLPDPNGSRQKLTLFVMTKDAVVYTGFLSSQLSRIGIARKVAYDYVENLVKIFDGIEVCSKRPGDLSRNITSSELDLKYDEFCEIVRNTVDTIRYEANRN